MLYSTALFAVVCASSGTKEGEKIPASNTDAAGKFSAAGAAKKLESSKAQMKERVEWLQNFLVNRPFAPGSFCRTYKNAAATENVCPDEYCVFDFKATESEPGKKDCTRKYFCEDDDRQKKENKDQNGLTADQKSYCDKVNHIKDSEAITELPPVFETYVDTERAEKEYDLAKKTGHNAALDGNFWDFNVKKIVDMHKDIKKNLDIKNQEENEKARKQTMDEVTKETAEVTLHKDFKEKNDIKNQEEQKNAHKQKMDEVKKETGEVTLGDRRKMFENGGTLKESSDESEMSMDEVQRALSNFPDGGITIVTLKDAEKLISRYNRDELELDEQKKALEYVKNRVEKIKVKAEMYVDNIKKKVWTDELKHFCRSLFLEETKEQKQFGFQFERDGDGKITGMKGRLCQDPKNDKNQKRCESHYTQEACEAAIDWQTTQFKERQEKEKKKDRGTKVCKFESSVCSTSEESNIKGLNGVGLMMGDSQETFDAVMKKLDDEARAEANKHQYKTIDAYGRCTDARNTRQVNNIEECKAAAREHELEFDETESKWGPGCRVEEGGLKEGGSKKVRFDGRHESMDDNKTPIRRANNLICAMLGEIVAQGEACNLKHYCYNQKAVGKAYNCDDAPEFLSRGNRRDGENGLIFICDSNGDDIIVDTTEKPSTLKQSTVTEHIHF